QQCISSVCTCTQGVTPQLCTGTCTDLSSAPDNCGSCGNACAMGSVCSGGVCASSCGALTQCNGGCVNTQTDNANCGSCGNVCPTGATCIMGSCTCGVGETDCTGL